MARRTAISGHDQLSKRSDERAGNVNTNAPTLPGISVAHQEEHRPLEGKR